MQFDTLWLIDIHGRTALSEEKWKRRVDGMAGQGGGRGGEDWEERRERKLWSVRRQRSNKFMN